MSLRKEKMLKCKKIVVVLSLLLFSSFFYSSCSKTATKQVKLADNRSYEASLYRQNCMICHGAEAEGKEVSGKMVPSLRVGEPAKKTEAEIYNQIANGGNGMLSFKNQLNDEQIRKMTKFVMRDLQGRE